MSSSTYTLGVEQFPSQASNNLFLKSQNLTVLHDKTKQTNDNLSAIKSISELNFTKSERKVRFGKFNDSLDESGKRRRQGKRLYF